MQKTQELTTGTLDGYRSHKLLIFPLTIVPFWSPSIQWLGCGMPCAQKSCMMGVETVQFMPSDVVEIYDHRVVQRWA
uniref:Uncharacterized protein n=1 Tax=Caenorhabditis japonica TaxID=281687 RepID=A0A8R1E6A3_CAEJA